MTCNSLFLLVLLCCSSSGVLGLQLKAGHRDSNANATAKGKGDGSKLIINSNAMYDIARNKLIASMLESGFSRFSDVIVILGGSQNDSAPYVPQDEFGKRGAIYLDVKLDSFDYHGFSAMYHHMEHPWTKADRYMFIHDTVIVNKSFPQAFDAISKVGKDEVYHPPAPFSNICVIGSGVVAKWKTNFDYAVNKAQSVSLEFGQGVWTPDEHKVEPLLNFAGKDTAGKERIDTMMDIDLYGTGYPRRAMYYPEFSLTKYFLFNRYGDLPPGPVKDTYGSFLEIKASAVDMKLGF